MHGAVFGGPLERLRQAARVDVPRLADEYAKIRNECETSSGSDHNLDRPAHFDSGTPGFKNSWVALRNVIWTAAGETSENLWDLSRGLDGALDRFAAQDIEAANALKSTRWDLEHDSTTVNDEWTAGYNDGNYPRR